MHSFEQVENLPKPTDVPDSGIVADLLWNDPDDDVRTWYLLFRLRMKKQFGVNIEEVRALEYHDDQWRSSFE